MLIEIVNWDKYNPRNDAKKWSWFRFQNDFFDDEIICDLSATQKLLLAWIFCRRNKSGKLIFRINPRQASQQLPAPVDIVTADLQALAGAGLISIHPESDVRERTQTNVDVRERTQVQSSESGGVPYGRTDGRTLRTDGRNPTPPKKPPKPPRILEWVHDDPLAKAFENLKAIPAYWAVFDREHDRETLQQHMTRHALLPADIEQVTWELRCYVDGCSDPIKSPRGKLATFVSNYANRRAREQAKPTTPSKPNPFLTVEDIRAGR